MRKIKGTKIIGERRQIYVFVEIKRSDGSKRREWLTEFTDLTTTEEIKNRRKEMRQELFDKLHPAQNVGKTEIMLAEWLSKWFIEIAKPNLAPRTAFDYEKILKDFLFPFLKKSNKTDILLIDINALLFHDLFVYLKNNKKEWAISRTKKCLSSALNEAVRLELLDANPLSKVKVKPYKSGKERKVLSKEDVRKILVACETYSSDYSLAVELILFSGLRPSEAIALRWQDVDFKKSAIKVRQSVTRIKGEKFEFKTPKSSSGTREIYLSENLIKKLKVHRKAQDDLISYRARKNYKFENLDLVFATRFGTPVTIRNLNERDLREILEKAGLNKSDYSLYSLRHSIASLLLSDNANIKDIQNLLGHSTAAFTMNTYIHALPDSRQKLGIKTAEMFED